LIKTHPAFFAEACEALAELDLREEISSIRNAVLVVVGELDTATPPDMARELTGLIDGAELIELRGCGHAPMAQMPEMFIKSISGFLGLNTGAPLWHASARGM
jgi:3-oxoadipate enol-lactonase